MRHAELVAGKSGMDNIVTAVSVLEYSGYSEIQEKVFSELNYEGSDIVLTAFSSLVEKPEMILNEIMESHATGEAGVIIYYFDLFVKKLDQSIIDFANDVGYPIIVMPRDQFQLRYSEAITEIQELISEDKRETENYISTITERFISLPKNQQNVSAMLKLLSNYLHLTLIMTERDGNLSAFAGWPNILEREADEILAKVNANSFEDEYEIFEFSDIFGQNGRLIVVGDNLKANRHMKIQLEEVSRLILKMIASEQSESIGTGQLLRALIGDEPVKLRKLARNQGIDANKLRNMMIFRQPYGTIAGNEIILTEIKDMIGKYCRNMVADTYSNDVVVFLDDGISSQWLPTLKAINEALLEKGLKPTCAYAKNLDNTARARQAYLDVIDNIEDCKQLYRKTNMLSYHEILYVKNCKELVARGEEVLMKEMEALHFIQNMEAESTEDLIETLSSFYFDSHMSVSETAENLYIHVNTVKYRLKKISESIGCKVTDMPEMAELYKTLALKRLVTE